MADKMAAKMCKVEFTLFFGGEGCTESFYDVFNEIGLSHDNETQRYPTRRFLLQDLGPKKKQLLITV